MPTTKISGKTIARNSRAVSSAHHSSMVAHPLAHLRYLATSYRDIAGDIPHRRSVHAPFGIVVPGTLE